MRVTTKPVPKVWDIGTSTADCPKCGRKVYLMARPKQKIDLVCNVGRLSHASEVDYFGSYHEFTAVETRRYRHNPLRIVQRFGRR